MTEENREESGTPVLLRLLLRRMWIVLVALIAVIVPILLYNSFAEPVYEAHTTLIYESPPQNITDSATREFVGKEMLLNSIQEITSRAVALEVVDRLSDRALAKIATPPVAEQLDKQAFYAAQVRKNIQANPVAESQVIQISVSFHDAFAAMTVANTLTEVLQERNLRLRQEEVSGVRGFIEEQRRIYKEQLEKSETALRRYKEANRVTSLDQEVEKLLLRVSQIDGSYQIAKADRAKTEQRLKVVREMLEQKRLQLGPSMSDFSEPMIKQLKNNWTQLQNDYIRQQLLGVPEDNPKMVQMRAELNSIRNRLAEQTRKLAERENVIDPLSEIAGLYEETVNLELELETLRTQERSLASALDDYSHELNRLPGKEYELARLTRERDLSNNIYNLLAERREEARITEAQRLPTIRVIDVAELPTSPVWPRKRLNLALGLILGLTIGIGLAFFVDSIDTSLKTAEEVEQKIGLNVIGAIPRIHYHRSLSTRQVGEYQQSHSHSRRLIAHDQPSLPATEAYRTLRTNLQFYSAEKRLKTLMLTSSGPREGKSTTVANLAAITAQMGVKTLLIDADLRKPTQHRFFGLSVTPGLANLLSAFNRSSWDENRAQNNSNGANDDGAVAVVQRSHRLIDQAASFDLALSEAIRETGLPRLSILTAGDLPDNPAELLAGDSMRDLLEFVSARYDFVLVDSPPVIAVADAAIMAPAMEGVALVIQSGLNDKEIVIKTKNLLERVNTRLVGAILNNVHEKNLYGDYNYYYTYYTDKRKEST